MTKYRRLWALILNAMIASAIAGCTESLPAKSGGTPEDLKREASHHRQMRENEAKNR